tara:strand:+ start:446 stop:592 length:147 start_codon:yes stop_codon:yes gene_type:complete
MLKARSYERHIDPKGMSDAINIDLRASALMLDKVKQAKLHLFVLTVIV